jgi:DNA-binding NarL/FixJ family response regulator
MTTLLLLVTKPGYQQQSFSTLLQSIPEFDVIATHTSTSACEVVETRAPQAVLIDSSLPNSERERILDCAKRHKPSTATILIANGHGYPGEEDLLARCVDDVISKNESISNLTSEILRAVKSRQSSDIDPTA